jgi:hypothetical protein
MMLTLLRVDKPSPILDIAVCTAVGITLQEAPDCGLLRNPEVQFGHSVLLYEVDTEESGVT